MHKVAQMLWAGLAATVLSVAPAFAQDAAPPPGGWDAMVDSLRDLPDRMLARLPEDLRQDPQIRAEVDRVALASLASAALDALASDGDHPAFIPQIGQALNIGQPNADTVYRTAQLTPGASYRLRGERGSVRMIRIRQSGAARLGPGAADLDLNAVPVDAQGRFDVLLSAERPAGYAGAWWRLDPAANLLLMRMVSSDWAAEVDPTISIERVDGPVARPRPSAAELERRLHRAAEMTSRMGLLFIDHVAQLRAEGVVNRVRAADFSQIGGLTGQFYYEGVYDLRDDEALILEARVPAQCLYWSVILTNALYETTDWYNNQSSLNDRQARVDADGVLRVVVSARDPGVPNWLDTAGYPLGVVQGRWTECDAQPAPTVRKVRIANVRRYLPRDTRGCVRGARADHSRTSRCTAAKAALVTRSEHIV